VYCLGDVKVATTLQEDIDDDKSRSSKGAGFFGMLGMSIV